MLVKLYDIEITSRNAELVKEGIYVKKANVLDKDHIIRFIRDNFGSGSAWAYECEYALSNSPITCHIAACNKEIIGFSCFDATTKGFFGPMGVKESFRKKGVGAELLMRSLNSMKESGYAYAIIGSAGKSAVGFYKKLVNAMEIPDSPPEKSIYSNLASFS